VKLNLKRGLKWLAATAAGAGLLLAMVSWSGLGERWAQRALVRQIERMTGGRVELKQFRFRLSDLRAELTDFTLHGREAEGMKPFFHADALVVDVRVDSLLGRKISLDEVRLVRPQVHVRFDADGRSNVPQPATKRPPGRPWRERLFTVVARRVRLEQGELLYNDVRVPLVAEGGRLDFSLAFHAPASGPDRYEGEFAWQNMVLVARRYLPFSSSVRLKFTLGRDDFELTDFRWNLPQSELRAGARLRSFLKPAWEFRFGGALDLLDLKQILRKPNSPAGRVDFDGRGSWAQGELALSGTYQARQIAMPYQWFHAAGIESRGSFRVARRRLEIPDFEARLLGGRVRGRVEMQFEGVKFRVTSRAEGLSVARVLAAVANPSFPLETLHWNGIMEVDSVTTWDHDFKNVATRGLSLWKPEGEFAPGEIPASARLDFDYSVSRRSVALRQSEVVTPSSRLEMDGRLGARDSALEIRLRADDLLPWNELINRLRGRDAEPKRIAGRAEWRGRLLGEVGAPQFEGQVRGSEVSYGRLGWSEVAGEVSYSPAELRLSCFRARRGRSSAALDLYLQLTRWSFLPENQWELALRFNDAPTDELQELLDWRYPVRGLLTARLRGRGTRADPEFGGPFELTQVEGYGFRAESARGELGLRTDELRLAGVQIQGHGGRLGGSLLYRFNEQEIAFDADARDIALERVEWLQSPRLPLGGRLSFRLEGRGPLAAPEADGTLRLADFRAGGETLGTLEGRLHSRGRAARAELRSAMATGTLDGQLELQLVGDYPLRGHVQFVDFDLHPFVQAGLRLKVSGEARARGRVTIEGPLRQPRQLEVVAELEKIAFDYQTLKFENVGPLQIAYRNEQVNIAQAEIRGPETDLKITGGIRLAEQRALNLRLSGSVNLKVLSGFLPELDARGVARLNTAIDGTLAQPRVVGGIRLEDASANYGDFPAGLSHLTGDFVFDSSRLVFENVRAEAGGGQMVLGGTVNYGASPLRFDLNLQAARVRVRYPPGMSWLAGGRLRLAGTPQGALLSGRVLVERALLGEGFDLGSLIVASREGVSVPATGSPFLRNLQFDVEAASVPNALLELASGRFEAEAQLRVRGTWERPIFLGHIHLAAGEMRFRGNRYRLSRGDILFSNPLLIDPEMDIEATTTVQQYEVTLNFSGRASRLSLAYRSDPPLPASDVIALLALGRTGEESELRRSGTTETAGSGAAMLLSEAISSQLGGRIERLFGISRFRFDPLVGGSTTSPNSLARITIEQQVAPDFLITYSTDVNSTEQQVIQVEYNLRRNLSIVALRDKNGTFGLDVKFRQRFK
jgi:translocation and assembly module TamB